MENSLEEKRATGRTKAVIAVEILQGALAGTIVETSNVSESGTLVLKVAGADKLRTGDNLELKVSGLMGQSPKILSARVIRNDGHGIALEFGQPL